MAGRTVKRKGGKGNVDLWGGLERDQRFIRLKNIATMMAPLKLELMTDGPSGEGTRDGR